MLEHDLELLIDSALHSTTTAGVPFSVSTYLLSDGWHDIRVLAFEDTNIRSIGRWIGEMTVDNRGRSAAIGVTPSSGDMTTAFSVDLSSIGSGVEEVRLIQNGRVVAAATGSSATLTVHGLTFGAGPVRVQTEALFDDGERVRSAPQDLDIAFTSGAASGQPPEAFGYTKRVLDDSPFVLELPATFDDETISLSYQIISLPTQSTVVDTHSDPWRLLRPAAGAAGTDELTFQVTGAAGSSTVVTVRIEYTSCDGDLDGNNAIDLSDLSVLLSNFGTPSGALPEEGDLDGDGDVDLTDLAVLLSNFGMICR